ncbi:hypothetical protein JHW43_000879 [Diplocarpon mali]|nr:hypothetical protein JHW43_000879 [Diplocarpon mali]
MDPPRGKISRLAGKTTSIFRQSRNENPINAPCSPDEEAAENTTTTKQQATLSSTDQTFHRFSQLPRELMVLIWHKALLEPQIITVKIGSTEISLPPEWADDGSYDRRRFFWHIRPHRVPERRAKINFMFATSDHSPLLYVNHQSRCEAEKFYSPASEVIPGFQAIMANPKIDCLWITGMKADKGLHMLTWPLLKHVQPRVLALSWDLWGPMEDVAYASNPFSYDQYFLLFHSIGWLLCAEQLRELVFILADDETVKYGHTKLVLPAFQSTRLGYPAVAEGLPYDVDVEILEDYIRSSLMILRLHYISALNMRASSIQPGHLKKAAWLQQKIKRAEEWEIPRVKVRALKH